MEESQSFEVRDCRSSCCPVLVLFPAVAAWLSMANINLAAWEKLENVTTLVKTVFVLCCDILMEQKVPVHKILG